MLICKFFALISLAFNHLHLILGIFTITQIDAEPFVFAFAVTFMPHYALFGLSYHSFPRIISYILHHRSGEISARFGPNVSKVWAKP